MTAALGSELAGVGKARRRKWRARGTPGKGRDGRRGRPRDETRPSAELLAKRAVLAGPGGDPAMTAVPLDVIETRRLIDPDQAESGRRLARWHDLVFGRPWPPTNLPRGAGGGAAAADAGPGEAALSQAERHYALALALLDDAGPGVRATVVDVAIHLHWPRVITVADAGAEAQLRRLRKGLDALVRGKGVDRRR